MNALDSTVEGYDGYVAKIGATVEVELSLGGTQAAPTFTVRLKNPTANAADAQLKLYRSVPNAAPVAVDLGAPALTTIAPGQRHHVRECASVGLGSGDRTGRDGPPARPRQRTDPLRSDLHGGAVFMRISPLSVGSLRGMAAQRGSASLAS